MDEEAKMLLRKNLEVTRENNRLLRKIRRSAVIGGVVKIIWWAVIIGVPFALYYYILQPYMAEITQAYQNVQEGVGDFTDVFNKIPVIGEFLKDFLTSSAVESIAE